MPAEDQLAAEGFFELLRSDQTLLDEELAELHPAASPGMRNPLRRGPRGDQYGRRKPEIKGDQRGSGGSRRQFVDDPRTPRREPLLAMPVLHDLAGGVPARRPHDATARVGAGSA